MNYKERVSDYTLLEILDKYIHVLNELLSLNPLITVPEYPRDSSLRQQAALITRSIVSLLDHGVKVSKAAREEYNNMRSYLQELGIDIPDLPE